ncbi:PepSY-associated TM helix domain-containing protein [Corynebacterium timonense]|uniref:Uncharacterized iron-regulated membrane protein n=1 Tax=Corynebacterium timonense TaxID=441500 RepID=A0A1H1T2M0_9CORY|nr:PepSY domain-containing protein [Corynebacterium timonense]SDS54398.1 Uncharacterized iron-regulated membrane protein [Corynebacterium timonense]
MTDAAPHSSGLPALTRRIHFYAGLFIAPFIIVAALSGALYALAPTLENVVYRDILTVPAADPAQDVALSSQVSAAQATHPDMDVAQVWPSSEPTEPTRVLLIDESLAENKQLRSIFVNPHTGAVIGDEPTYSGLGELPLRRWISSLHESMHLGPVGELYSELAASWLWVVALGGVYLWWRMARTRALTGLATTTGRRRKLLNLHGVAGTWLLVGMLGLSVTGITWSTYGGGNVDRTVAALGGKADPIETSLTADSSEDAADPHAGHGSHGASGSASASGADSLTADEVADQAATVLDTARAEGLTGQLRLFVPEDTHHAWQASERWVPWRLASDAVSINGETGAVVDRLPFSELPLFSKLTSWGIYLHMGIMFGLPLQIALAALALGICAMAVMGYMMWWRRRPTKNAIAGVPGRAELTRTDWVIIAAVGIPVGAFLPLLGLSFAAMLVADRLLARRRTPVVEPAAEKELQPV